MSPRLICLLTTLRTHHGFERDRDRIDARLAAARMAVGPAQTLHLVPDPVDVLPVTA